MKGTILKRLEDLERLYKQDPLIVLARTDSGEEIKITMRECLEREDTQFMKVIAGSSLQDLDLLLKATHEEAERQAQEGEAEDAQFMKVIAGRTSPEDLDLLLNAMYEDAERQAQEGGSNDNE